MKFLLALLASTAVANQVARRQVDVFANALNSIITATGNFQTALDGYQPGDGTSGDVLPAADALITAINDANTAVAAATPITVDQAIDLLTPLQDLEDAATSAINALISREEVFTTDCVAIIARDRLADTFAAVRTFETTAFSKLDEPSRQAAQQFIDNINADFQRATDEYADATLPASCSATSTTTTTTPSGTATATTTTTTGTATGTTSTGSTTTTSSTTGGTTGGPGPTTTRTTPPIYTGAAATMFVNYGAAAVAAAAIAVL